MCVWVRSPPEELVLPKQFPRVRIPFLAALLSPIAWQVGRPDLFDSYSAGVLLLQLAGKLLLLLHILQKYMQLNTLQVTTLFAMLMSVCWCAELQATVVSDG